LQQQSLEHHNRILISRIHGVSIQNSKQLGDTKTG